MLDPDASACFACGTSCNIQSDDVSRAQARASTPVRTVRTVSSPEPTIPETHTTNASNRGTVHAHARGTASSPEAQDAAPDLLAGIRNGAWLNEQDFPPLSWSIPGLIPEGLTLLVGPPKAGKSWVLLGCLLAMAAGGHALGHIPCDPSRVLNMAFEDGDRRQQDRCRSLMGRDLIPARYDYLTRLASPDALFWTMAAYLDRHEDAGMIAVDTLGKVMPDARAGETTYSRDYRIGGMLKKAADSRRGLSVVAVHHDRKAVTEDFVESVSGTNGLAGAADTIIVLTRKRQSAEALLQVTGRDVIEAEYALKLTQGVWELDGRTLADAARAAKQRKEEGDLGEESRRILAFIGEHTEGVRAKDVAEKFGPSAHMYLKRLFEADRIDKAERGVYILRADPAWEAAS
jgi:hypothetical protein